MSNLTLNTKPGRKLKRKDQAVSNVKVFSYKDAPSEFHFVPQFSIDQSYQLFFPYFSLSA